MSSIKEHTPAWIAPVSTFIGASVEPFIVGQPLYTLSKHLQGSSFPQGEKSSFIERVNRLARILNPRQLYAGVTVASPMIGTVTFVQKLADQTAASLFQECVNRRPSEKEQLAISLTAGMATAPLLNTMEAVTIQKRAMMQEAMEKNEPMPSYKDVHKQLSKKGVIQSYMKGVIPLMMREGIHTMMLFSGWKPIFNFLHKQDNTQENSEALKAASRLLAGVFGAVVSHPADWAQTALKSGHTIHPPDLLKKGFKGVIPRATRAGAFSTIVGTSIEQIERMFMNMSLADEKKAKR